MYYSRRTRHGAKWKAFLIKKMAEKGPIKQAIEKPPLKPSGDTYLYIHYIVVAQDLHKFYIWKDIYLKSSILLPKSFFHFYSTVLPLYQSWSDDLYFGYLLFIGEFLFFVQFSANKIYSARIYWTLEDSKDFFLLTRQSLAADFKDQTTRIVPILDAFYSSTVG